MAGERRDRPAAAAEPGTAARLGEAVGAPVILVADDEETLTAEICDQLQRNGLYPVAAHSLADCLLVLTSRQVDAILLDHSLGPVDALPLLPALRAMTDAPILIHTGSRDEADRILGFELGADDVLVKPVSGRELVARLRARLRGRRLPLRSAGRCGWRIVAAERRVYRPDGSALRLTTAEFDTLQALAARRGEVRSREELTRIVFRRPWRPGDRAVDNAVLRLRQKLGREIGDGCIVTVRQQGYLFAGFPEA
ncbi:MAG: response regulator transcription factor [Rhodovarius sp.]|nr:response regulator transcription factor [Rhodovarius sp.]MDW8316160.1 response regulator transcription factor [Rhodovarius sp.]